MNKVERLTAINHRDYAIVIWGCSRAGRNDRTVGQPLDGVCRSDQ